MQIIFTNETILSDRTWILVDINYRKNILSSPFQLSILLLKSEELRGWIIKLLRERIIENHSTKAAIENWLEYSNNLKNLNS